MIFIKDKETVAHLPFLIKNPLCTCQWSFCADQLDRNRWLHGAVGRAQSAQSAAGEKETAEVTKCLENISSIIHRLITCTAVADGRRCCSHSSGASLSQWHVLRSQAADLQRSRELTQCPSVLAPATSFSPASFYVNTYYDDKRVCHTLCWTEADDSWSRWKPEKILTITQLSCTALTGRLRRSHHFPSIVSRWPFYSNPATRWGCQIKRII